MFETNYVISYCEGGAEPECLKQTMSLVIVMSPFTFCMQNAAIFAKLMRSFSSPLILSAKNISTLHIMYTRRLYKSLTNDFVKLMMLWAWLFKTNDIVR